MTIDQSPTSVNHGLVVTLSMLASLVLSLSKNRVWFEKLQNHAEVRGAVN